MKSAWLGAVGFFVCMGAAAARAEEAGLTSALSLLRAMGARPAAMGEAFVAAPGDIQSLGFNPANVATIPYPILSATYLRGFADDQFGVVNYAHTFSFGAISIGGSYYDAGPIDIRQSSGFTGTRRAAQDTLGQVGLALGREFPVSVGAVVKFFKFELAETAQADGVAGDAGLEWRTPIPGIFLGGSVQNFGSDIKFEVEDEPLPLTVRGGLAYKMDFLEMKSHPLPYNILFTADGARTRQRSTSVNVGLELKRVLSILEDVGYAALRTGYNSEAEVYSAGVGFQIKACVLDYALNIYSNHLDPNHRVTIGWEFQPVSQASQSRRRLNN